MAAKTPNQSAIIPKGFTLLELIIASAILLVITGGVVVNFNAYNDKQIVKEVALTLKSDLRFAQSKASAYQKPIAKDEPCFELVGYTTTFTDTSYTITPTCVDSSRTPYGIAYSGTITKILPSGTFFSPVPSSFTFYTGSTGTSLANDTQITISSMHDKTASITVSKTGIISHGE